MLARRALGAGDALRRLMVTAVPSARRISSHDRNKPGDTWEDVRDKLRNFEYTYKSSDHFTFDPKNILQEPEDERAEFDRQEKIYSKVRFGSEERKVDLSRGYEVSQDPAEWEYVTRLLRMEKIPVIPEKDEYPSGFVPPKRKPGDLPYHVYRTKSHMLPVYTELNRNAMILKTKIRYVDGNLYVLRDELAEFLQERYHMEFISQVAELYSAIFFRGDFEEDFKEFLLLKGF